MQFLSAEHVVALHDEALRQFGGAAGGGHRGGAYEGVEAAVQAVKNSYYEAVEELAAAYAVYIVQGHVFLDGNKRAGAFAMETFLDLNGIRIWPLQGEVKDVMVELQRRAEAGADPAALVEWLAGLLRKWAA